MVGKGTFGLYPNTLHMNYRYIHPIFLFLLALLLPWSSAWSQTILSSSSGYKINGGVKIEIGGQSNHRDDIDFLASLLALDSLKMTDTLSSNTERRIRLINKMQNVTAFSDKQKLLKRLDQATFLNNGDQEVRDPFKASKEYQDAKRHFRKRLNEELPFSRSEEYAILNDYVDEMNRTKRWRPIASLGISGIENGLSTSKGVAQVGVAIRVTNYKLCSNGWIDPAFVYAIYNVRTAVSNDTGSIQKSFLFPELNKRDFTLGWYSEFRRGRLKISPMAEFSLNKITDSTGTKHFVSNNFVIGAKFEIGAVADSINGFLSIFPYHAIINVDPKYKDYELILKEAGAHHTFHCLGMNVTAEVNRVLLFCNMKYILNKEKEIISPDLKRFVYTVGTLVAL